MKRAVFIAICMLVAGAAWSQSDADYRTWMKTIGPTCGSLKKNLDAKMEAAAADARNSTRRFADVHDFFQKNIRKIGEIRNGCFRGFDKIAAQASAGKFDEASATFKETTTNCAPAIAASRKGG